jgi:peroxiredoxin
MGKHGELARRGQHDRRPGEIGMSAPFYLSYGALWLLVVVLTLIVLGLVHAMYSRADEEEGGEPLNRDTVRLAGSTVPDFTAVDLSGNRIDKTNLVGSRTALLFVSANCSTCAPTLRELEALKSKMNGSVIVFCHGERESCGALVEAYSLTSPVVVDDDNSISELFGVRVTPTAVLIGADGRIESYGYPLHPAEFEKLLASQNGILVRA